MSAVNRIVPLTTSSKLCTCPVCEKDIPLFERHLAYHTVPYDRLIVLGNETTIAHRACGYTDNEARKEQYWVFEKPKVETA